MHVNISPVNGRTSYYSKLAIQIKATSTDDWICKKVGLVGSCFSQGKPLWCGLEGAALKIYLFTEGQKQVHHCQQAYETTHKNSAKKSQEVDS